MVLKLTLGSVNVCAQSDWLCACHIELNLVFKLTLDTLHRISAFDISRALGRGWTKVRCLSDVLA